MSSELIILRGPSGSGKTFESAKIITRCKDVGKSVGVASADHYFIQDNNGVLSYKFEQSLLSRAHRECQMNAEAFMRDNCDVVIIDNTNSTAKEVVPYIETGFVYDYEIRFVEPVSPWWIKIRSILQKSRKDSALKECADILYKKNEHNVPSHVIINMLRRYELDLNPRTIIESWKYSGA